MRMNKKSILKLQGKKPQIRNFSKKALKITAGTALIISLTVGMTEPVFAQSYPNYAYVPYNQDWGSKEENHEISIFVTENNIGVVRKSMASKELLSAIVDFFGEDKVANSKYDIIIFEMDNKNEGLTINKSTFSFYKKKMSTLGLLKKIKCYLPVKVFMAPDNQQWIDEKSYIAYVSDKKIIYQCSDGSLAHSYQEYKDWECEMAYHPNKPIYPAYSECNKSLSEMDYLESSDGTIWKDQAILDEYLNWKQNRNFGIKDGIYFGTYGVVSSFEDYVRLYNVSYYVNEGLKREEQFYGVNGFLYSNREKALLSIDKMNGYQKKKEK